MAGAIQRERDHALSAVSELLASPSTGYRDVLQEAARQAAESVGEGCTICLLSEDRQWIHPVVVHHRTVGGRTLREEFMRERWPASEGILAPVVALGEPLVIADTARDEALGALEPSARAYLERTGIHSFLVVPIRAQGQVIGTFGVSRGRGAPPYDARDRQFLQELANRVTPALDNARLIESLERDMTARERAEQALRQAEERLRLVIDNTTAIIYAKRKDDFRYIFVNREFERMFRLLPGEIVGQTDEALLPANVAERVREGDRQVIESGEPAGEEEVVFGGRTYKSVRFPLPGPDGTPYAVGGVLTDITDRKRREAELAEREKWEERIRSAIEHERLVLYSQPIVNLATGAVDREELLIRMRGSRGPDDLIPPAAFLPPAERFDLIGTIDRWVVRQALALARRGRQVTVNLSSKSIGDLGLTREVAAGLDELGADASKLTFEVTESAALEDLAAAREFAERLTRLGCGLALDDFGTGYGSFTYLKSFPVQYLKVDTSFVRNLCGSLDDQRVVKSMVTIAGEFGQKTIAEGVEDSATLGLLERLGVDFAQGYHLGAPAPLAV